MLPVVLAAQQRPGCGGDKQASAPRVTGPVARRAFLGSSVQVSLRAIRLPRGEAGSTPTTTPHSRACPGSFLPWSPVSGREGAFSLQPGPHSHTRMTDTGNIHVLPQGLTPHVARLLPWTRQGPEWLVICFTALNIACVGHQLSNLESPGPHLAHPFSRASSPFRVPRREGQIASSSCCDSGPNLLWVHIGT